MKLQTSTKELPRECSTEKPNAFASLRLIKLDNLFHGCSLASRARFGAAAAARKKYTVENRKIVIYKLERCVVIVQGGLRGPWAWLKRLLLDPILNPIARTVQNDERHSDLADLRFHQPSRHRALEKLIFRYGRAVHASNVL